MLTVKPLKFNSVLVQSNSTESLSKAFMRFQEHYESPKFKGQIFTIGQLKQWYSITYGADTYIRDWIGFNLPSHILQPFQNGLFDPLIPEEQELLDLFKYRKDSFYIIGANDDAVLRHELAHALYAYSTSYRNQINNLCKKNHKEIRPIVQYLIDKGYAKDVIYDEIQAYVTDNDDKFIAEHLNRKIISQINKIYKNFDKQCSP